MADQAAAVEFDGLVLPGGVANPDNLRTHPEAVEFVREFFDAGKPVGVICHGPWTLIEAAVVDSNLVTSRKPDDLDAFNAKVVEGIEEGSHATARS